MLRGDIDVVMLRERLCVAGDTFAMLRAALR